MMEFWILRGRVP